MSAAMTRRGASAALLLLGMLAAGVPSGAFAADGSCCGMPACCEGGADGCPNGTTMDRVGCCGPRDVPAVPAAAQDAPATRAPDDAQAALPAAVVMRAAVRDTLLLADRGVTDGPPSPVPLFTVHASLLL